MNLNKINITYLFVYTNGSNLRRLTVAFALLITQSKGNIVSSSYKSKILSKRIPIIKEILNQKIRLKLTSVNRFLLRINR